MENRIARKELIRQYKESVRPMGVFRVTNKVTGRTLIGASVDIPAMLNRQRAQLKLGGHPNKQLQLDWNELGAESFEFEIIDILEPNSDPQYNPNADLQLLQKLWKEKLLTDEASDYNYRP